MKNYLYWQSSATRKEVRQVWTIVISLGVATLLLALSVLMIYLHLNTTTWSPINVVEASDGSEFCTLSSVTCSGMAYPSEQITETLEEKITRRSIEENVNPNIALRILDCESNLDPLAKNKNSSASGLGQFLSSTWKHYCEGDVFNGDDNLECFLKLYPQHPNWWVCS